MPPPDAAVNQHQSRGASPSPHYSAGRTPWPTLLLLFASGTILRFLYLTRKPFWFDESFSAEVARVSWGNFLHLLWWREANMSLYYLLLRIWLQLGHSEFYIRSLSVVIAAATIPAIYWLARVLYDRRVALIAAALFTFNAYSVRYAQEARSYALFLLLGTLSSGFLIALVREPVRRNRISYVLISILAVYAHFYALLLLAAQWLSLRWLESGEPGADGARLSDQLRRVWTTIGVAVLPLLVFVAKTGAGPIRWIQRPGFQDLFGFFVNLAGSNRWPLLAVSTVACIAAVAPLGRSLWMRSRTWETWRCQFLLLWLLFPVGLTVLLSFARPVFLARYMIFCLPALLILVAAGLARLRQSWLLVVALTSILLFSVQGIFFVYANDFDTERDASGAAAAFLLDQAQPGDAVVFHIAATRIPYEFVRSQRTGENTASPAFTSQLVPEILFPRHGPGLDYRDFTGKPTADFLRSATLTHPRVWVMLMNNGPADNPDATTFILTKTFPDSLPKVKRWQFAKVEVRLYSKE
jgi:mannosyltransferase